MAGRKPIEIDGSKGEGGGQILRMACALAAVTSQPVRFTNIRANRPNGGGLKDQHVTGITWLAQVTSAQVTGLSVGSKTLEFRPTRPPSDLLCERKIRIVAHQPAASALLIFQTVFPVLLFAGSHGAGGTDASAGAEPADGSDDQENVEPQNERRLDQRQERRQDEEEATAAAAAASPNAPIELIIAGGINVSFAPTYDYFDQVFLPELEARFENMSVKRELRVMDCIGGRGNRTTRGEIWFEIQPLPIGTPLRPRQGHPASALLQRSGRAATGGGRYQEKDLKVHAVDVYMVAPQNVFEPLTDALVRDLMEFFPTQASSANDGWGSDSDVEVDVVFMKREYNRSDRRAHVLLVARSATLRWGTSVLGSAPKQQNYNANNNSSNNRNKNKYNNKNTTAGGRGADESSDAEDCARFCRVTSREVVENLVDEVNRGGTVDCYLQDQLVIFQALAEGRTAVPRPDTYVNLDEDYDSEEVEPYNLDKAMEKLRLEGQLRPEKPDGSGNSGSGGGGARMRKERTTEPFGQGTWHARTARWVASCMLPGATWYNKGRICDGVGFRTVKRDAAAAAAGPLSVLGESGQNARAEI